MYNTDKSSIKSGINILLSFLLYFFAIVMIGIAFYLCLNESIWSDEAFSLEIIQHPYLDIMSITADDVHPPLYYFVLKLIVDVVRWIFPGASTVIIGKCVSVVPIVCLIAVAGTIIRKEWGILTSAIFAIAVIGMPHLMYLAIEIRMYSWAMLFVTLAFLKSYFVAKYKKRKDWIWFVVFSLAAAYTHYFALIEVAFAYLYLLLFFVVMDRKRLKEWIICAIATIIGYLPWLGCVISQVTRVSSDYWLEAGGFSKVKDYIIYIVCPEIVDDLARLSGEVLLVLFALMFVYMAFTTVKKKKVEQGAEVGFVFFAACSLPATMIFGVVVSVLLRPIFLDRYLIPAAGVFWLALLIVVNYQESEKRTFWKIFSILISLIVIANCAINTSVRITKENSIKSNYSRLESILEGLENNAVVVTNDSHLVRTLNTITGVECYLFSDEDVIFRDAFYDNVGVVKSKKEVDEMAAGEKELYFVLHKKAGYPMLDDMFEQKELCIECGDYCLERYGLKIYKMK